VLPPSGARERPLDPVGEVKKPEKPPEPTIKPTKSSPRQYAVASRSMPRAATWW
jgi:hypothetical protein